MDSVNLKEARRRLSDLVKAAESGESITITRRGRDVARLVPIEPKRPKRPERLPDLAAFRASVEVRGKPLSEVVIEARQGTRY